MKRRQFITLLGGAAAWPVAARAQQRNPVVGFLSAGGPPNSASLEAFRRGLGEIGYVEGRNVSVEVRSAEDNELLPALAEEFAQRQVSVIVAFGNANAALAAEAATKSIPIVFQNGADPVKLGLVASLNRPGGNLTGVSNYAGALGPKRLELLREMVPNLALLGILSNPTNLATETATADMQAAASSIGQQFIDLYAGTLNELEEAFAVAGTRKVDALLVIVDAFFSRRYNELAALTLRHRIPTSFPARTFVDAGGLVSYSDDRLATFRQVGIYTGRILNGEKPAELPVQQPTKFDLVINLHTAKMLGLTIPPTLLATANEVIE